MTTLLGMKIIRALVPVLLVVMTGCATAPSRLVTLPDPETVMVTYHVKPGQEAEFEKLLSQAWIIYEKERLVVAHPHIVLKGEEGEGKYRFVEIFTWTSHSVPDRAPEVVTKIWAKMTALCEKRNGRSGLEGGEVHFLPLSK